MYDHFWKVRMNPLRRRLIENPPEPRYPWANTSPEERQAWLDAHCHQPRLVPPTKEGDEEKWLS